MKRTFPSKSNATRVAVGVSPRLSRVQMRARRAKRRQDVALERRKQGLPPTLRETAPATTPVAGVSPDWLAWSALAGERNVDHAGGSRALVGGVPITTLAQQALDRIAAHEASVSKARRVKRQAEGRNKGWREKLTAAARKSGYGNQSGGAASKQALLSGLQRLHHDGGPPQGGPGKTGGGGGVRARSDVPTSLLDKLQRLAQQPSLLPHDATAFYLQHHSPLIGEIPHAQENDQGAPSSRAESVASASEPPNALHQAMFPNISEHTRVHTRHVSAVADMMLSRVYRQQRRARRQQRRACSGVGVDRSESDRDHDRDRDRDSGSDSGSDSGGDSDDRRSGAEDDDEANLFGATPPLPPSHHVLRRLLPDRSDPTPPFDDVRLFMRMRLPCLRPASQ